MLNSELLFARYAGYLALCLRAALLLGVVIRHDKGNSLSSRELAELLEIDPIAGRSFFNVLVAIGILKHDHGGYSVEQGAYSLLLEGNSLTLAPYLSLGIETDSQVQDFIAFLRKPNSAVAIYSTDDSSSLMDATDGIAESIARALASRAKRFSNVLSEVIANRLPPNSSIVDLGAGSPFLAHELLTRLPTSQIILADRPNATRFITKIAQDYEITVQAPGEVIGAGQIGLLECNMFVRKTLPKAYSANAVILSNIAHDWSLAQVSLILKNIRSFLKPGAIVALHEGFLGTKTDYKWMAAYGMALNHLTQGQGSCYFVSEYDAVFQALNFSRTSETIETTDGCHVVFYQLGD